MVADPDGPYGTLMLPSFVGGANWPGGSVDPETGVFYQYSFTRVTWLGLVHVGTLVTKTLGTDVAPARPCARPRVDRRRGRPWRRSDRLSVRAA